MTRGILALLVVLWHVEGYKGVFWDFLNLPGRTAVILFFGMSGYVISYGFIHKKYLFNRSDIWYFYKRRIIRIMPLFILISTITLCYHFFLRGKWLLSISEILPEIFMFQFNHSYSLNTVFWTLGVEMQFYLIAPLLIYFTMHFLNGTQKKIIFYCLLFGLFLIMSYYIGVDSRNLFGNLFHFFSGIITCSYIKNNGIPKYSSGILFAIILLIVSMSNYLFHNTGFIYYVLGLLMVNLCIPMIIFAHHNLSDAIYEDRLKLISFFLTSGTVSYGIYAWHPFIIEIVNENYTQNLLVIMLFTISTALISYFYFEKPILSYVKKKK